MINAFYLKSTFLKIDTVQLLNFACSFTGPCWQSPAKTAL
ncbi:hypothetical protein HMPREF0494_0590 [Limosilactobacillus antri DSM 16041]|uniref:Uncharacterized protein n=1 Tax=Limosilactobacillus antri DSM 16041 TaxID=525309 RepID=C8P5J6_9LACO|nr:hypothetical protein HMPREF0494_0590 [Limosilactobacillus antri DSM 16041]